MSAEPTQTDSESAATASETDDETGASTTQIGGADTTGDTVVSVRNLRKTYGDGDEAVTAVDGVSFDIERGTVVGLLGPNGAGKTTTIKSILGLVLPSSGEVEIAGVDVHEDAKRAYRHVGATLEGARNVYWRLTVRENVEFFASLGGQDPAEVRDRYERLLEQFGLAEKAEETVNDLSRGMKQKVSLVCTLARGTDVVFLDEPTLGLDVESSLELRRELRQLAEQESITVVLSSHDMDVVEDLCERVVVMNDGRVVADDSVANLVEVFGTRSYQITVADSIPDSTRERLRNNFGADAFERVGENERFEVTLAEGDDLYAIFDALRAGDCSLDGVTATDPDLETVFLELTNEDGDDSASAETPATATAEGER
ncbi:ABC transporter ATP-binding protein [Halorussus halophilus]|uniref:ABC transporter ATP-binding protein n=1 Tax=Halorussus halophilus TaxID=2650975 RepID=UPI0013012D1C|nr:ABC transporter ATP-binding protein [Halorussus halophilus]